MIKKILILSVWTLFLCSCRDNSTTTFTLRCPDDASGRVEIETIESRQKMTFTKVDTLQEAIFHLPLTNKGMYVRLWVGNMSYTTWAAKGKPWTATFKRNVWNFEGGDSDINNYLKFEPMNKVLFIDYYRISNEQFRAKLDKEMKFREEKLRESNLESVFVEQEVKRLRYIRNKHIASRVVYGDVKDGRMDLVEDTESELRNALTEDPASWEIFEYRESIDKLLLALAKMDNFDASSYDVVLKTLKMAIANYKDKRLLEFLVSKNVMGYVKAQGMEYMGELDSIFREYVHAQNLLVAYDEIYKANKKIMRGEPATPFTFENMEEEKVSLSDFKGKYVYIDLWATWCGPCVAEIPYLKKLEEHFSGKEICFVSISSDKSRETWEKFVNERKLEGVQLFMGEGDEYVKEIICNSIPRFLLIDRDGNYIDSNMTRPSDPKTLEFLEQLDGLK